MPREKKLSRPFAILEDIISGNDIKMTAKRILASAETVMQKNGYEAENNPFWALNNKLSDPKDFFAKH